MPLATEHAYICTREYHSTTKKNEIMPFAATWMQLEVIKLSEVGQKESDKYQSPPAFSFWLEI